jgi:hypothetical protein
MAPDQVTYTPDPNDPQFVIVTGSWGYRLRLPAGWQQMPPPVSSDSPFGAVIDDTLESFRAPDASVSLAISKLPAHPPGEDALQLLSSVVSGMKADADQGIGALTNFQILDPPHSILLPGADSAATAETSSKLIILGGTAIQRSTTALRGEVTFEFLLTSTPDLAGDTPIPTGFELLP